MKIRLTKRDMRILRKCMPAKWLTTSQIQQLFFSNATRDVVQKRLRKLGSAGYLLSCRPDRMSEAIHTPGHRAKQVLESEGYPVKLVRKPPVQLDHFIGINDIRIQVEKGCFPVKSFFAAWELGAVGWTYPVIPDAVFRIEKEGILTFLVEYDRGTESLDIFAKKLRIYQEDLYGFTFNSVLIIGDGRQRIKNIGYRLQRRLVPSGMFLGSLMMDIHQSGLYSRVFSDLGIISTESSGFLDLTDKT